MAKRTTTEWPEAAEPRDTLEACHRCGHDQDECECDKQLQEDKGYEW
jgi:hypothetical protein